jgi:lipopolysaccharide export system permease protein
MRALVYILMLLPTDIYQFFPMAGLLGSLMGLGLLASRSELIVMRAAGVSLVDITRMVIVAASVVLIIAVICGEVIAPIAQRGAEKYKSEALSSGQTLRTNKGTWVRNQHDFLHIGAIPSYGHLENVTRYQFDPNDHLTASSFAAKADYNNGAWVFSDITETKVDKEQITTAYYKTQNWALSVDPKLLGATEIETNQKSLPQLYSHINYLRANDLNADKYEFAMWQRFVQPFAALVMILLAVPFIFGPLRSATMGLRMLAGAVVGIGFYMLNQFAGPIGMVFEFPALPAACLPTLVVTGLGAFLLVRAR